VKSVQYSFHLKVLVFTFEIWHSHAKIMAPLVLQHPGKKHCRNS